MLSVGEDRKVVSMCVLSVLVFCYHPGTIFVVVRAPGRSTMNTIFLFDGLAPNRGALMKVTRRDL